MVFRVVHEFLTHLHREECTHEHTNQGSRHTNLEDIEKRDVIAGQKSQESHGSSRDRASSNTLLGSNHGNTQRTFRTDFGFCSHFGNHREHRVSHMASTCQEGEEISDQRSKDSDMRRILTQELFRNLHHVIQATSSLHTRSSRDNRSNHEHHINGRSRRLKTENKGQYGEANAPHHPEADTSQAGTDDDGYQYE